MIFFTGSYRKPVLLYRPGSSVHMLQANYNWTVVRLYGKVNKNIIY
jgi:hypothetical protein